MEGRTEQPGDAAPDGTTARPPARRGAPWPVPVIIVLATVLVVTGFLVLWGPGSAGHGASSRPSGAAGGAVRSPAAAGADQAFAAAAYFLDRYELPSGRVVRWDQGGDTVSEGEAYAMLLSVAVGSRSRFDAAWAWTKSHLLQPSGLLAWHWAHGHVTDDQPASDADVDAAYALSLAARRFGERADLAGAAAMAAGVVSAETVRTPSGRVLVAGPWAVGPPSWANPSYAAPSQLAALGGLADRPDFDALAAGSRALLAQILSVDALPPDWVQLDTAGLPLAVAPPGSGPGDPYGFDAVRLPVRWAASCDAADRRTAAALWPSLDRAARQGRATVDLAVAGGSTAGQNALRSPVGVVAAAAAGWAAGEHSVADGLLSHAEATNRSHPTYYSSAWVALGRMFLQTRRLGTCGGP